MPTPSSSSGPTEPCGASARCSGASSATSLARSSADRNSQTCSRCRSRGLAGSRISASVGRVLGASRRDVSLPGATETEFFERADMFERAEMMDTKVGTMKKDDPADVAKTGFDAMMRGAGDVVAGWQNKLQTAIASVTPAGLLAEQHRRQAKPGTAG